MRELVMPWQEDRALEAYLGCDRDSSIVVLAVGLFYFLGCRYIVSREFTKAFRRQELRASRERSE